MFEPVAARYDGPELEKAILEFWRRENVFGRIMAEGEARPKFVFYEGPPTANGRPGIHHVLARTFKDLGGTDPPGDRWTATQVIVKTRGR